MRKIPRELENPVDNICIDIGDYFSEIFYKLGFSANGLTGVSLILGIISIYYYIKKDYLKSSIFFFISYMFDCFDGFFARKYNMVSNFGDAFDHFRDITINLIIFYLIFIKYWSIGGWKSYLPFIVLIFVIMMEIQIGCQEMYANNNNQNGNKFLSYIKYLCPKENKKDVINIMKMTRYFGTGSYTVYMLFLILYSYNIDNIVKK